MVALLFFPVLVAATSSRYINVEAAALRQDTDSLAGLNIYFTEAGKEASRFDRSDEGLSRFAGLLSQLGANLYTLEWRTAFPTDADLIIVAGPQADLAPDQTARLWAYMNNGGHVLLLAEPITGAYKALPVNSGLFQLTWTDMGIRARNDVVVMKGETNTNDSEATPEAGAPANGLIANFTATNINTKHAITDGFSDESVFSVARSIEYDAAIQGYTVTPLVATDNGFYGESAYDAYLKNGTAEFNIGADTSQGSLALAVAFENPKLDSRFVVIGDRQFATNGGGLLTSPANSSGFVHPGNAQFLVNCVSWLVARATIQETFPTPGPTATVTVTPTITPTPSPTLEVTATPTPTAAK